MKKMGIIGGAGPLASALLYEMVVKESYQQALEIPEILLVNYPFTRGLTEQEARLNQNYLKEQLDYCLKILVHHQVEVGILACNTLHLYLETMSTSTIGFVSIPQAVIEKAKEKRCKKLLILGTQNTCRSLLYQDEEIEMGYIPFQEQLKVDQVIDRVLQGKILAEDSAFLSQLIQTHERFYDGVVLGCTDLPVLHHLFPLKTAVPLFDSIKIPAKKIRGLL